MSSSNVITSSLAQLIFVTWIAVETAFALTSVSGGKNRRQSSMIVF
jgi:hypothetical protein